MRRFMPEGAPQRVMGHVMGHVTVRMTSGAI
jgi:hypothetical protein